MGGPGRCVATLAAIAAAAVALALLHVGQADLALVNNGDGFRMLRSAGAGPGAVPPWTPMPATFPIAADGAEAPPPQVPAAVLTWALGAAHRAAETETFRTASLAALYYALALAGLMAASRALGSITARATLVPCALLAFGPAFGALLVSPYEQAAALALAPLALTAMLARSPWPAAVRYPPLLGLMLAKPYFAVLAPAAALGAIRHGGRARIAHLVLVGAAVAGALLWRPAEVHEVNRFHRVFNGLAYTEAGVGGWPERDWGARMEAALRRIGPPPSGLPLPEAVHPAWGMAWWPDAATLPPEALAKAVEAGSPASFAALIAARPDLLPRTFAEAWRAAVRADYSLCYIRPGRCARLGGSALLLPARHAGLAFAAAPILAVLALAFRNWPLAALYACIALAPGAIVLGDGYFEFERHLLVFPPLALLALPFLADRLLGARDAAPPAS